jgi:hypothetical protein
MNLKKPLRAAMLLVLVALSACSAGFQTGFSGHNHTVDSEMPVFESRLETDHFVLKWTSKSSDPRDNISDPKVVMETAGYLETAWEKYSSLFGRSPYTAPGKNKVEVVFRDIDCYGVADPPEGPIQFNASAWVKNCGIRQPTSAHELFHKLQYAYGYKTKWHPQRPYMWFTEGTAAWSEVFVWGRVSRTCKVDEIFKNTKLDLYDADDMAMPFWIYFVQGNHDHPDNELMVQLLQNCEQLQNEKLALNKVIKENYGPVDKFFAAFARERKNGFWTASCSDPYKCILGPEGNDVVDEVKSLQKKGNKSS